MANPFLRPTGSIQNKSLTPLGQSYWGGKDNLPITNRELPTGNPVANQNSVPQGSLQGTMTQPQAQSTGSLTDFATVMRAISEDTYDYRQGKEGKVLKGQFDPTKVSGSIFSQIMGAVESRRGKGISKMYEGAVEAAKFDIEQKEKQRQATVEQENKKFDLIKQKTELGIDSVYIPGGTLADRNNNPGNLRFVGQAGASEGEGGFAKFNTPEDGWMALQSQVRLDQSRGLTLQQFVSKYAPSTENDTNLYIQQMSQWMGVDPNVPLSSLDYDQVAEMVARKESGTQLVKSDTTDSGVEAMARRYKSGEITAAQIPVAQRGKVIAASEILGQVVSPEQRSVLAQNVSVIDKILENYGAISGPVQTGVIPFGEGAKTKKLYDQLKGIVSLDKRQALKGQGTISDFEFKVLSDAATSMSRTMSEEDFKQALTDIKGAFATAAGQKVNVQITKEGEVLEMPLSRDEINDLILDGAVIKYI